MQTFAASMHSSISLCASLRTTGTIRTILPLDVELELHLDAVEVDRAARFAGALAAHGTARRDR